MKATQFIKDHGLEKARGVVEGWIDRNFDDSFNIRDGVYCNLPFEPTDDCETLGLFELKRLVESVDLVNKVGGIENAKTFDEMSIYCISHWTDLERLTKSIADYESIYGEEGVSNE
ncbi:hypothetical protein [Acinetobacter baumannii]|uniref:hypothetical protein n=1 Tax=Acinetobacter baumannii TaxID=470 RepID=UPI0007D89CCD|nr:hypothetical protein [Acinetobacter baumannii]EKV6479711.1 hypothetical protein [Acinetobacter baumannii]EKX7378428.1 hypothetical protein [Acinetobacter baumannii]MCQ9992738.1 hypothetical protein [Acinetobacter baumannii]OFD28021.1 hypothetical protein A1D05_05900 [Acinetobacter baumannii]OFD28372.1 hypothetical protein A1D07_06295 [Acinetobacter baumannii]